MITIRASKPEEYAVIVQFQCLMAKETENLILSDQEVSKGVQHILNNPELGQYIVAEYQKDIVACLLIQFEWSDWRNKTVIWLHSLYVKNEYRQSGIFKKMYDFIKAMVNNDMRYAGIRLFVDKTNTNAQKAYWAVGMNNQHYELFEWMKT